MTTAALLIALIGSSITVAENGVSLYTMVKAAGRPPIAAVKVVHHHTTRAVYRQLKRLAR